MPVNGLKLDFSFKFVAISPKKRQQRSKKTKAKVKRSDEKKPPQIIAGYQHT